MAENTDPKPTITLNVESLNLQIGDSTRLTATTTDYTGNIIWSSTNSDYVTVDTTGLVKAIEVTENPVSVEASITIEDGATIKSVCEVTVSEQTKIIYTKEFFKGIPADKRNLIYSAAAQLAAGYLGFDSTVIMGTGGGIALLMGRLASLQVAYPWILSIAAQMYEYIGGYDKSKAESLAKSLFVKTEDGKDFVADSAADLNLYNKIDSSTGTAQNT